MALQKLTYTDGVTVIPASNLNAIQDAIIALENKPDNGVSDDLKVALLQLASKVAYIDDQGQTYYQDLYDALYPPKTLVSITAVFTQGSTIVYDNASLDSLKTMLAVTAHYDDNTTAIVPDNAYTLSGTLTPGPSTVTVTYNSKTTTFTVNVTAAPTLSSISAVYTQGGTVYTNDSLDSLKQDLVVTAHYSDSSSATVPSADYSLSGALAEGTQTITVTYSGKTTTFTVACTVKGWLYHFNQSLASSGSEDFNLTGNAVYGTGRLGTDYAYSHIVPTPGTASSDTQYGLKATGLSKTPDLSGDFTLSFWMATQSNEYCHPYTQTVYVDSNTPGNKYFSSATLQKNTWSVDVAGGSANAYSGFLIQGSSGSHKLIFRFSNSDLTASGQIALSYPTGIDTTQWHHYALTKENGNVRFFFDGELIATAVTSETTIYNAAQVAISANFGTAAGTKNTIQQMPNGEKMQDLYIAEWCKWTSSFDPTAITY